MMMVPMHWWLLGKLPRGSHSDNRQTLQTKPDKLTLTFAEAASPPINNVANANPTIIKFNFMVELL